MTRIPGTDARVSRILAAALTSATLLVAAGCASPVRTDVRAFHQWPEGGERSFRLVRPPEQAASLEFAEYDRIVGQALEQAGFSRSATPRFDVRYDVGVEQRVLVFPDPGPVFVPSIGYGSGGWGWGGGLRMVYPIGGAPRSQVVFDRRLRVEIDERAGTAAPRRVWEGTAVSSGSTGDLTVILPLMARSLLQDFPGPSGITRRVELPMPEATPPGAAGTAAPASATPVAPATAPPR